MKLVHTFLVTVGVRNSSYLERCVFAQDHRSYLGPEADGKGDGFHGVFVAPDEEPAPQISKVRI